MSSADRAMAGQTTAASIIGQVTDESGAVLPGVTVTATSPAWQVGSVTSITDAQGEYRLAPLLVIVGCLLATSAWLTHLAAQGPPEA